MYFSTVRVNLSLWVPGWHPDMSGLVHTYPTEHRLGLSSPCAVCKQAVYSDFHQPWIRLSTTPEKPVSRRRYLPWAPGGCRGGELLPECWEQQRRAICKGERSGCAKKRCFLSSFCRFRRVPARNSQFPRKEGEVVCQLPPRSAVRHSRQPLTPAASEPDSTAPSGSRPCVVLDYFKAPLSSSLPHPDGRWIGQQRELISPPSAVAQCLFLTA